LVSRKGAKEPQRRQVILLPLLSFVPLRETIPRVKRQTLIHIGCACYVITWEFIYFNLMPDFAEKYSSYMIENMRAKGASPAELAQKMTEMKRFQALYNNVFFNAAITFLEPLSFGLIMTFISALILRRSRKDLQDAQDEVKGNPVNQVNPV